MGEIGLFGMFVSEKYGGQELDYISYIIGVEEIARVDGSQAATVAAGNSLGIGPIYYFGTEEQKKKYLPKLCTRRGPLGFRSDRAHRRFGRRRQQNHRGRDGNEWVINGSKIFITNAACEFPWGSRSRLSPASRTASPNTPASYRRKRHCPASRSGPHARQNDVAGLQYGRTLF
jgi:short-chain 2-methylacyl-CoA dehydrogenase